MHAKLKINVKNELLKAFLGLYLLFISAIFFRGGTLHLHRNKYGDPWGEVPWKKSHNIFHKKTKYGVEHNLSPEAETYKIQIDQNIILKFQLFIFFRTKLLKLVWNCDCCKLFC